MDLFPYEYRGKQEEIVNLIRNAVTDGKNVVIESGTGTGKTVVSLAASLEAVFGSGKKIVYLTRTKSQQKQIMSEVRKISERIPVLGIGLQGRSVSTCPMMLNDPELQSGTPEELSKLCAEFKRKKDDGIACKYFENLGKVDPQSVVDYVRNASPEPEEFVEYCTMMSICPYETMKLLLPYADVIAAPYPFIFMPNVCDHFLQWVGRSLRECVIIIDEAHNLPDYLREVMTCEYSRRALELAEKEALQWGDPEISGGLTVTDVTSVFKECMEAAIEEYLHDDDGAIPVTFLQDELMSRLGMSSLALNGLYKGLVDQGEIISESRKAKCKLPRSYIGSFGRFLQAWELCDEETHISLIIGGENPKLQSYCLDPFMAAEPLRLCWSSVNMSGTLEPLNDYSYELGLEDSIEKRFDSPFDPANLKVAYVDDVSTKFEELSKIPETYGKLEDHVVSIVRSVNRNTAVFFSSFKMMDRFIADGIPELLGREIYYERREMTQNELMKEVRNFRMADGGVLFSITGGRVSEGLDFPDKDLELVVMVGIPYPKPTAKQDALRRYCDFKFGDGWEHSVKVPTMRKMRQAIGRIIRSETDRGVAVILDRRISTMEDIKAELIFDPCAVVKDFFSQDKTN